MASIASSIDWLSNWLIYLLNNQLRTNKSYWLHDLLIDQFIDLLIRQSTNWKMDSLSDQYIYFGIN